MEILSQSGAEIFGRWVHYFAGVAWIGMLWFLTSCRVDGLRPQALTQK